MDGSHHFKYTPVNLTVYTAAYSGAVSGLVGSSRWLLDSTIADYGGFTRIAGAFAMSFDLAWEADPDTNPPDTLQVFVIEKTCKAVWEDRDTLANAKNTNSSTFTQVSEAIIALILASQEYFSGQGITPAPWPSGSGGGGVTAVLPGVGIGITGPIDTPTVNNGGVLAVDPGTGIAVSTLSGVATVTATGVLEVESGTGITVTSLGGIASVALAGVRTPWTFTAFFVDPSNVSGHASDSNDGLTATTPILTTAEFNKRIFLHDVQVDCIVTYMSDDIGQVQLDLSTVSIGLGTLGSLTFQGTPQVLHTGGTINAGTIAINPSAPGGGQRQVLHTSDISDFTPYVIPPLGGTASHPCYVQDSITGDSAWIVSAAVSASPSMSRPVTSSFIAGVLTIGNGYKIQRGSIFNISQSVLSTQNLASNAISFQDFAFGPLSFGFPAAFFRCSWDGGTICGGGNPVHCFISTGIQTIYPIGNFDINAGVFVTTTFDFFTGNLNLSGDVYVTGDGFIIAPSAYTNVYVSEGLGAGAQFQDVVSGTEAGITCAGQVIFGDSDEGDALLWGNGNTIGMVIVGGVSVLVSASIVPTVTGSTADFAFLSIGPISSFVTTARPWDDGANNYGPSATTSWANFAGVEFNFQAHNVTLGASLIGSA
jgi:hypothetical protein